MTPAFHTLAFSARPQFLALTQKQVKNAPGKPKPRAFSLKVFRGIFAIG
jgi:hypothetical protein